MSRPEASTNEAKFKQLIQGWRERCGKHRQAHKEDWGTAFYPDWMNRGEERITELLQQHGEERVSRILDCIEGLSLTTQLHLLRLCQTEDAPHLIAALETVYPPEERGRREYKYDHYLQRDHLYQIEEAILRLKFPDQDIAGFVASLPSPSGPGLEAMALAREKGPDYILAAFEFIPPEQVSRRNFKKRLEIEKKAREEGEQKAERVIRVTGGVQDVGFRGFCRKRAFFWGITEGFARNEFDGSVTVLIQGCPSILEAYSEEGDFRSHSGESKISVYGIEVLEDREVTEELTEFLSLYAKRPKKPPEKEKPSFLRGIFGRQG